MLSGSIAEPISRRTADAAASAVFTTWSLTVLAPMAAVAVPIIAWKPEVAAFTTEPIKEPTVVELTQTSIKKYAPQITKPRIAPSPTFTVNKLSFTARKQAIDKAMLTVINVQIPTAVPILRTVPPTFPDAPSPPSESDCLPK